MKSLAKTLQAAIVCALTLTAPAFAADEYNVSSGLTASGAPLGLHGIDPVAFLGLGNRFDGAAKYAAVHDGVAYYFASASNRDAFKAEPDAFLPQNGGFCTFGVSKGKKFDGDPKYTAIVDGKLYVFLNEEVMRLFQKDPAGVIADAAASWPDIRSVPATEL